MRGSNSLMFTVGDDSRSLGSEAVLLLSRSQHFNYSSLFVASLNVAE